MAHHKRRRPKAQRAGCNCGTKHAKNLAGILRGSSKGLAYGSHGALLRLRARAQEA